jgi:hypothetical protein
MRYDKSLSAALVALAAVALPPAADAAPAVMVTDVRGNAFVVKKEKEPSQKLALLDYLQPGAELRLDSGARVAVTFLAKPTEVVLNGPATARVGDGVVSVLSGQAPQSRKLDAQIASAPGKFSGSARERITVATFEMKGGAMPRLRVLTPNETKVLDLSPTFQWTLPPGAAAAKFTLVAEDGKMVHETTTSATALSLPKGTALKPGASYAWKVEVGTGFADGKFSVADRATATRLIKARPGKGSTFSAQILYAALLDGEGFGHDALAIWQALARERPEDMALQRLASWQ